jgi:hypothetical protein
VQSSRGDCVNIAMAETYLFQSEKITGLMAFTVDPTGQNLPIEQGPWERSGAGAILPVGLIDPSLTARLELNGYALLESRSI